MSAPPALAEALRLEGAGAHWHGEVHAGWDIYGIPHGGYLTALAANAALHASGAADVLTITTHYLHKATLGPVDFTVRAVGGGRRLTSHLVEATQDDEATMVSLVSVGDRDQLSGPTWQQRAAPDLAALTAPAGSPEDAFPTPALAHRLGMRLDTAGLAFAEGRRGDDAVLRALVDPVDPTPTDQLLALVACDATPPAVWNVLGVSGWVPTVELTAQVRGRPAPGPLRVVATTRSVGGGLLEEDAEVFDEQGRLVVLSRQLARLGAPPG
jgi:acyl-coenzyme A thioesterase PaaI-like protein